MKSIRLRSILLIVLLSCLPATASLWAQTELLDPDGSIDDFFTDPVPIEDAEDGNGIAGGNDAGQGLAADPEEPSDVEGTALADLIRGSSVSLGGTFSFSAGYSAGWTNVPWLVSTGGNVGGFRHGAVTDTRSKLSLDFRIAPMFRVSLSFQFEFPTFRSEVSEFFADYILKDTVFFRVGRYNMTWGISRFYPYTNLTARLPDEDEFPVGQDDSYDALNDADAYAFRARIPIGAGGAEFIGFTRNGFMENPSSPRSEDIGWGGNYNLAIPYLDLTIGTFYHHLLDWRSYMSLNTTFFGNLEFYTEGLLAFEPGVWTPKWGSNAGFLLDFWNERLQWSGEYYYTNETRDLRIKGMDYPLIAGHNMATGFAAYFLDRKLRAYAQIQYNVDENTGLFVPALTWDVFPYVTITAASPVIFGDDGGTYSDDNPSENQDRKLSAILMAYLKASF